MPPAILLLVLFGLLVVVTPFLTIALFVREAKLRRQLNELAEENTRQHTKLQRAVGELQGKLAATSAPTTPVAEKPISAEPRQPSPVSVPRSSPTVQIPPPVVVSPRVELKPYVPAPATPPIPPAAAPPPEAKPTLPAAPPKIIPTPAAPKAPAMPPAAPAGTPPVAAARVSPPPSTSPMRVPAPKPRPQRRMNSLSSIEETLGTSWFAILGVIMLVIGLALLGKLALQNLGPAGKSLILYAVSLALLGGGIFLEKRDRYKTLGRVAIGGGWALLFFSTFGLHYVPAMRVVDSGVLDSIFMLAVAVAMAAHTLRYKSQFVTGVAFLLGYSTVALSQDTVYSLTAGVMLAIGLVAIVLKMGWFELEVFGILSTYLNHLYWLYGILGMEGAHGRSFPEYQASLALLFFYWLIFRISYVARRIKTDFEEHVSTVSAILSTLLFLGLLKFQSVRPELAYIGLLAVGILEFSAAQLPITRKRRRAFVLLSIMGAALILAAVPSHYTGNPVAILWLVGAEVFLAAGIIFKEVVFLRLGLFTGLLVGVDLIGFNFRPLVELRSKSEGIALETGILFALCAVVLYLNALYISSRWKESFSTALDRGILLIHSYLGAFAAAAAAWALLGYDWTAVAFAAIMLVLAAVNRRLESRHLQIQHALLGVLTLYRVLVFNLHFESSSQLHITTRLITLPILGAIFYATAKLAVLRDDQEQRVFRALFSFAGAAMFGALIWFEAPELWIGSLFLAAGILLALAARRWNLFHLSIQEHLFAIAAVLRTVDYNFHVAGHYGPFSIRLLTVSLVAAGLYAISRRATNEGAPHSLIAAYLHTTAATFLLTFLMWSEASAGWLAALWVLFAFALAAIDRRFKLDDLRWQAHALAALTMLRCIGVNLHNEELWHGLSVRLLTLAIVAVAFYAMSLFIRMPEEWRDRDFHHSYSWAASLLVSLLLWYELDPLGRAVGWAVFGLVLFEYGFLRKIAQFRYQAYVAFTAAFARIFFANLTASEPGELFGPRVYTVLPLILIFYFVYGQLSEKEDGPSRAPRFRSDSLVAYLGTATLAALFYFHFDPEWVVVSYAAMAFALFGVAWTMKREIFLHQGIFLVLATFARGMTHNLFGSSYFTNGDWQGRYLVLSAAVVILLATLFFAFPLREAHKPSPDAVRRGKIAAALVGRPEQLVFFTAVILVTVMLALKTNETMITVSWGIEGVLIVLLALAIKERNFLHTGFGLLLLCVGKVFAMDFWRFDLLHKVITFIGVGLALTVAALLYMRFPDTKRRVP
ncbi:MAG TPA: DUF2339 domain-containing protein [Candidatus Acidoferrum sp.]|nr:DUF2339 domain-containing protein [Candidatus Acidoferrum sp.]